ncbi:hypothetical protein SFOMI_5210 [Sphingobium fuliginis]|uniref:Uncharacterized protein n=1 Tax=Sphingobium fuliginis (strain ATCC 27551) TaxID=336203 RepID=A0A292ZP42_SPHSA|nr:hypothetical protein SFOMI_5210 [Sphingobium fuliginis]
MGQFSCSPLAPRGCAFLRIEVDQSSFDPSGLGGNSQING